MVLREELEACGEGKIQEKRCEKTGQEKEKQLSHVRLGEQLG